MGWWARLWAYWRPKRPLGERGERLATRYLRWKVGMKILGRNLRCPGGEIDIAAMDGDELVFVEVRTVSSEAFMSPEASIWRKGKWRHVQDAARWFIKTRRLQHVKVRFDVVAIVWPKGGKAEIRHHRRAFGWSKQRAGQRR